MQTIHNSAAPWDPVAKGYAGNYQTMASPTIVLSRSSRKIFGGHICHIYSRNTVFSVFLHSLKQAKQCPSPGALFICPGACCAADSGAHKHRHSLYIAVLDIHMPRSRASDSPAVIQGYGIQILYRMWRQDFVYVQKIRSSMGECRFQS